MVTIKKCFFLFSEDVDRQFVGVLKIIIVLYLLMFLAFLFAAGVVYLFHKENNIRPI
jgi:hypothetical protein